MTTLTLYHNPRCSTSRKALALLRERGIEPRIVEYLETPPDADTLREILARLGLSPRELMRKKEKEYEELGLGAADLSDEELIAAMVRHPRLIERPIAFSEGAAGNTSGGTAVGKAALGRPPERVLDVL